MKTRNKCIKCWKEKYEDLYFRSPPCPYCKIQLNFGRGICYDCRKNEEQKHLDQDHGSVELVD